MGLRQNLSDTLLLIKQDRKWQIIAIAVVGFIIWGIVGSESGRRRPPQIEEVQVGTGSMEGFEGYRDLVDSISSRVENLEETDAQLKEGQSAIRQDIKKFDERTTKIFKKMIERISDLESRQSDMENIDRPVVPAEGGDAGELPEETLIPFGDFDEDEEIIDTALPEPEKIAVIGAGDSVRIKLLAGVNAPTDGTPYPVVFKLVSDVSGPDSSSLPLGEARLIAAAQGSLTDSRALFRLTSLNIRYPDGSRKVINVDGWIVGEDGVRGMEGVLIDPIGKALIGSVIGGTVQGYGNGLAQGQQNTFVNQNGGVFTGIDGDVTEFAIGQGLNKAGQRYAKFIDQRIQLMVPHVKILSGRTATAVFSDSVQIPGLFDALGQEEFVFASLD